MKDINNLIISTEAKKKKKATDKTHLPLMLKTLNNKKLSVK